MQTIDIILKIIVPIVAVLSLVFNIFQYLRRKKSGRFEAERELAKREVEWKRLEAKHETERRDLLADCEGEIRERNNISVNTLTVKDNRRLAELHENQQREWEDLFAEMAYFQKILGQNHGFLLGHWTIWDKIKWRVGSLWKDIRNEN